MFTLCEPTNVKYLKNCVAGEYWISGSNVTSSNKMYNLTSTYLESIMHTSRILGGALIIGNGTSDTARSNAHTLDWNGVGWFQGGLQVGGTEQDGEGVGYVPAVVGTVQPGQLLSVKSVDENGKPTEWEVVDVVKTVNSIAPDENGNVVVVGGSGGKSGVYILAEGETLADAPADADVVIDPAGTPDVVLTVEQVSALIDAKLGVIENGTY